MARVNTKSHTDIKPNPWVETRLPQVLRPYARLARLDRPIGVWLLLLPGWWAIALGAGGARAMNAHDWMLFVLFALGAMIMRPAGCVINDLWDRDIDKKVERTRVRPLASGALSPKQAVVFLAVLMSLGLLILLQMNWITILLGVLSLPLIVIYPLMKRFTWWPQIFLGLVFNFGALMGWSAVTGVVGVPALLLYLAAIFWTIGYDTIYAHQDREDDALVGVKSSALRLGEKSRPFVAGFYALAFILILLVALQAGMGFASLLLLPAAAHLIWQVRTWDMRDQENSLKIFKSNRDFGLLVLFALLLSKL